MYVWNYSLRSLKKTGEEEILTAIKNETTPPKEKEELTSKEFDTSDKEQACEKEIEEDQEGISGDHYANESCIKQCFQVSIRLDRFCFYFYFDLHLQSLVSRTFESIRFHFVKSYVNILLLLLHVGSTGNFITRK